MPSREEPRCPYCLGEGRLPKVQDIKLAAHPPREQWQTCLGCGGTGRLKADDWQTGDGGGGWQGGALASPGGPCRLGYCRTSAGPNH
jgi:DnaJ-class molecular chaperone